ncbi:hypothetical protein ABZS66_19010 [Dactylosporangium sp. NPDC005572]|uniref:hypothetical protein n=1 Tax=Dactylosporangium sp. NPDC005572 TaxID=3156889 RepID=UPI0033A992A9
MNFLDNHGDAFGVALILIALGIVVFATIDRSYGRADRARRATERALRQVDAERAAATTRRDRQAYWRLHQRFVLVVQGVPVVEAAARAARSEIVDEPIPYGLPDMPNPYAPVWTSGRLLDDATHVHTEFGQVVRTRFGRPA